MKIGMEIMARKHESGFTIIELMIVIVVIAIIIAIAAPSFQKMLERNRLKSAVEEVKSDLQLAKSEAIKRSTNVSFSLTTGTPWSYTVDSIPVKTVSGDQFEGVSVASNTTTTFDHRQGKANASSVVLSTPNYQSQVSVSNLGRIRICTPTGQTGIGGYPSC